GTIAGRKSQCEPLAETILAKIEVGLSARRIYQDLVEENGFADSYKSVKRFLRKLRASHPERVWQEYISAPASSTRAPLDVLERMQSRAARLSQFFGASRCSGNP